MEIKFNKSELEALIENGFKGLYDLVHEFIANVDRYAAADFVDALEDHVSWDWGFGAICDAAEAVGYKVVCEDAEYFSELYNSDDVEW
jgi:hypothetical protein